MNNKIKVLFLDIDNTLLDFDAGAAWAMNLCFEKAGLKYRPEMFVVFKEENNKIWRRIELGELTMDDLFYADGASTSRTYRGRCRDGERIPQASPFKCSPGRGGKRYSRVFT